jgi:hypothetical protein
MPEVRRVAEQKAPSPALEPAAAAADAAATPKEEADAVLPAAPAAEEGGGEPSTRQAGLTLQQVQRSWEAVLQAVRQRNPATQGVLNTGCQPVEVHDEEIVVTFPYPFLREKLSDPPRRTEIQDALIEVLHAKCRLKLVLASDYAPRRPANPGPPVPAPVRTSPVESGPVESGPVESGPVESGPVESGPVESGAGQAGASESRPVAPSADAEAEEDEVPAAISRWAEEHGGQARFVPG